MLYYYLNINLQEIGMSSSTGITESDSPYTTDMEWRVLTIFRNPLYYMFKVVREFATSYRSSLGRAALITSMSIRNCVFIKMDERI